MRLGESALKTFREAPTPERVPGDNDIFFVDIGPGTGLWILEIQIAHPARAFGAFYEDLLISEGLRRPPARRPGAVRVSDCPIPSESP